MKFATLKLDFRISTMSSEESAEQTKLLSSDDQKQPSRSVLIKRCSENMQQIYRRTPMPKCDFNKAAKQLY